MAITQDFRSIPLDKLIDTCKERKNEGYRLAQLCPKLERDDSITLIYTFVKESEMINYKVSGIKKGVTEVPSVTELFIAAFVFENEGTAAHSLVLEGQPVRIAAGIESLNLVDDVDHGRATAGSNAAW